jgi:hypothetical protein
MSLAIVYSRAQVGVEAPVVTVEAHLANGLPALTWSGCRKPRSKKAKTGCAARLSIPAWISRAPYHPQSGARRPAQGRRAF